jgi:two-component system sensor histidine kinase DctS
MSIANAAQPRQTAEARGLTSLHLPRPFQAELRMSAWSRALWFLPALLTLVFVAGIVFWAQRNDAIEREDQTKALVTDTLNVEAQLRARLEIESAKLRVVAARLPAQTSDGNALLASMPEVASGLDRLWVSVTWLDASNQLLGQANGQRHAGQTLHLEAPLGDNGAGRKGRLLARYDPADLLKDRDFWWLASQYDVELLSGLGQVIASTAKPTRHAGGDSNAKVFEPIEDATLRLTRLNPFVPWFQNARSLALIAGLLLFSVAATLLLRREAARVAQAELDWRTEAAWRQSMEESALVGLRARDPQGRILYVNRTLCEMVGYSKDELLGLAPPLPFWPPEAVDEMMARNLSTLAGRTPVAGFETHWRHRSGRMLDVMIFESPLVDSAGRQVGWMGSIVDITERKRLEETERRQTEAMAHHARLTTMGEVASTLAHELNQPLTAIVSYSAGLSLALKKQADIDAELLDAMEAVRNNAAQAGRIVHRIRSRLSRQDPVLQLCDMNAVVREAVDLLRRSLGKSGIGLDKQLASGLPQVLADRVGIEQVIMNLVRNAADALRDRDQDRRIRVCTELVDGAVHLEVSDNGPGLQGRTIETLCASFYSTKEDGMGMGLAICRSIIEAHQGSFSASEVPAGGASFRFSVPVGSASQTRMTA